MVVIFEEKPLHFFLRTAGIVRQPRFDQRRKYTNKGCMIGQTQAGIWHCWISRTSAIFGTHCSHFVTVVRQCIRPFSGEFSPELV